MPKGWKKYERDKCEDFSDLFFGVKKPPGGQLDRDCPLVRADMSGANPSNFRPGDLVPNGLWLRDGRLTVEKFTFCIEVKYSQGIKFQELLAPFKKGQLYKDWAQATRQADELDRGIPMLVVKQPHTSIDYIITDVFKFTMYGQPTKLPDRRLIIRGQFTHPLTVFTLKDFKAANLVPPFKELIGEING